MATRVEGVDRLQRRLRLASSEIRKVAQREILRSALNIQTGAKQRAPVDTGRLRNSITFELVADGMSARIGTNVTYAPFVEFGTRFMRAQPFLHPAFEEERPRFRARLERAIEEAGRKAESGR